MWKPYAEVVLTWREVKMGLYLLCICGKDKMSEDTVDTYVAACVAIIIISSTVLLLQLIGAI